MYKRNAQGWSKHLDFIVVEMISLQLAYILAVYLRHHVWAYGPDLYRNLGIVFFLIDLVVIFVRNTMHNVVSRGYYQEASIK